MATIRPPPSAWLTVRWSTPPRRLPLSDKQSSTNSTRPAGPPAACLEPTDKIPQMSLVTLEDLAARLGLTTNPAVYVTERGFKVLVDWSGRAAVTTEDAAALVAQSDSPT